VSYKKSTPTALAALREVVEQRGIFCALYTDRGSHFRLTPKAGEIVDRQRMTQIGRAMRELDIETIPAYSPQARGVASGTLAPGKAACRKSCACAASPPWRKPTASCGRAILPS